MSCFLGTSVNGISSGNKVNTYTVLLYFCSVRYVLVTAATFERISICTFSLLVCHICIYIFQHQQALSSRTKSAHTLGQGPTLLSYWLSRAITLSNRQSMYVPFYVVWLAITLYISLSGRQMTYDLVSTLTYHQVASPHWSRFAYFSGDARFTSFLPHLIFNRPIIRANVQEAYWLLKVITLPQHNSLMNRIGTKEGSGWGFGRQVLRIDAQGVRCYID